MFDIDKEREEKGLNEGEMRCDRCEGRGEGGVVVGEGRKLKGMIEWRKKTDEGKKKKKGVKN